MCSATTFDLAGTYDALVTVSNINAQTVEFSGVGTAAGANLTLVHATPVVSTDTIAFEMNAAAPEAALTLTRLSVATGLASVNIDSTGAATTNVITNISTVDDSITVTGGTHLTLGSAAAADHYTFASGTINALGVGATGGVTAFLAPTAGTAQTFVAGPAGSTNLANVSTAGGGVIDFSHGGTDSVTFNATAAAGVNLLADNVATGHHYNNVLGFGSTAAVDSVNISVGGIPTFYTDTGVAVAAGDTSAPFAFTTGTTVTTALTQHANLIVITPPINSVAATTPQTGFDAAIGGALTDGIAVTGVHSFLVSYYDNTNSQAVLAEATSHFNAGIGGGHDAIDNTSTITVVGLIHETALAYANLAANTHFVA